MAVVIRIIELAELRLFGETMAAAFSEELPEDGFERAQRLVDPSRNLCALDGGQMVGTTGSYRFALAVPGSEVVAAGVTAVTVLPTHRRRGILRELMRYQLDELHTAGEPAAILWASEGAIYGRFGYGLASMNARIDADRDRTVFRDAEGAGTVRLLDHAEALELFPDVYERARAVTPGFYGRSRDWWDAKSLADPESWRGGAGPLFRALVELDGRPEGYALYRVKHEWAQGGHESQLRVQEAIAASPVASRELWRYLFGVDLVARVQARRLAPDEPLRLFVFEPARLRLSQGDGLWLRLVDAQKALRERGYAAEGSLALELIDDFCPWNAGIWRLETTQADAVVERVREAPELRLSVADLASTYLGGFTFGELARAARVEELAEGAVERAERLFRTERAPWCPELF